jgi:plastocyanin
VVRRSPRVRVHPVDRIDAVDRRLNCRVPLAYILFAAFSLSIASIAHAQSAPVTVEIFDKPAMFRPEHLKIKAGQTIKWTNKGETVHTVTADPSQAPDPSWVSVPPGSEELDSGYMNPGDSFSYVFKVPGTYKYFCLTHEQEGMRAQVEVEK